MSSNNFTVALLFAKLIGAKIKLLRPMSPFWKTLIMRPIPALRLVRRGIFMANARSKKKNSKSADKADGSTIAHPFHLVSVERTEAPSGAAGRNWHRYTIRQGGNDIHGYLQGSVSAVKSAVEEIIAQLNERRAGRWGYRTTRTRKRSTTTKTASKSTTKSSAKRRTSAKHSTAAAKSSA